MKFLFLYKGSNGPKTDEYMKEWMEWLGKHNLMKVGSQVKGGKKITKDEVSDYEGDISGFSEAEASSLDEAVEIAKGCPGLTYGDSVKVLECWQMPE